MWGRGWGRGDEGKGGLVVEVWERAVRTKERFCDESMCVFR